MSLLDIEHILVEKLKSCTHALGCPIKVVSIVPLEYVERAGGVFNKEEMSIASAVCPSPTESMIGFLHEVCHCLVLTKKFRGDKDRYDREYERLLKTYGYDLHPEEQLCNMYGVKKTKEIVLGRAPQACLEAFVLITVGSLYQAKKAEEGRRLLKTLETEGLEKAFRKAVEIAKNMFCRPEICKEI